MEPSLFEMIFNYMDVRSISRLESCCSMLRDMVVQTNIYKRRWRRICTRRGEEDENMERKVVVDEEFSQVENSRYFKKKLYEYYHRYTKQVIILQKNTTFSYSESDRRK